MKRRIYKTVECANTKQTREYIVRLLSDETRCKAEITLFRSIGGKGVIHYFNDKDVEFGFGVKSSETRKEVPTQWHPNYTIKDDGSVYNEHGEWIGYVRISTSKPSTHPKDYDLDSIIIYKGTRQLTEDLTPSNANIILDELEKL